MFSFLNAYIAAMLAVLTDTGADLETGELILLSEPYDPETMPLEKDIVRPTFTGYADAAIAAWLAGVNGEGEPYIYAAPIVFSPTNDTNLPQYIYGAAILDSTGAIVGYSNWADPLQLSLSGQVMHAMPKVSINPNNPVEIEGYVE
jgi:hypothetical protein